MNNPNKIVDNFVVKKALDSDKRLKIHKSKKIIIHRNLCIKSYTILKKFCETGEEDVKRKNRLQG